MKFAINASSLKSIGRAHIISSKVMVEVEFSISTLPYVWRLPLNQAVLRIKSFGFNTIEIRASKPDAWAREISPEQRRAVRGLVESQGMKIGSLTPDWGDINLASPNPGMRLESVKQVKEAIKFAGDLGGKYFTILPGRQHTMGQAPREIATQLSIQSLAECAAEAEANDVLLCMEGANGQLFEKEEDLVNVVKEVGSKVLRIAADVAIANTVSSPVEYVRKIRDYIGSVHLADNDGRPNAHLPFGIGKMNFTPLLKELLNTCHDKYWMFELWYPEDPDSAVRSAKRFADMVLAKKGLG